MFSVFWPARSALRTLAILRVEIALSDSFLSSSKLIGATLRRVSQRKIQRFLYVLRCGRKVT
jgi:hypothetical protein